MKLKAIWRTLFPKKPAPFYKSCAELPLKNFINCLVNNEVFWLLKPGPVTAPMQKLEAVWDEIFFEYLDLIKDTNHLYLLSLIRDITKLESEYNLIYIICRQLFYGYNEELLKQLSRLGYPLRYDPEKPEKLYNDIKLVLKKSKVKELKIKQLKTDLDKLKKDGDTKQTTAADFDSLLVDLSKFQGYRLDPAQVTVSEFVAVLNRYKAYQENLTRQQNNGRKN